MDSKDFRLIIYSAQQLVPVSTAVPCQPAKKRKSDDDIVLTQESTPKGLSRWIDRYTEWSYAMVTHDIPPPFAEATGMWRLCADIPHQHQHIFVHSTSDKMEKTIKAYIRHESKTLSQVKARMFKLSDATSCFRKQFLSYKREDISWRGNNIEDLIKSFDLDDYRKRAKAAFENVWEMEKTCPVRKAEINQLTDHQKRILAKVESIEKSDSPFKETIEDFLDLLGTGWGSIYTTHHSTFLEVNYGLTNAQCTCWECLDSDAVDDEATPSDKLSENDKTSELSDDITSTDKK